MRIGLIDLETKIFNSALMQISQYHKSCGDSVEWWQPLTNRLFDRVYCSSIFDFTDKSEVPEHAICGGTGFEVASRLPAEIESSDLDYSIYPECRTSYLWFSRGCVRNCPWCVVGEKEGPMRPVAAKNLNPNGKYITICDNNFFASPAWRKAINFLIRCRQPTDFQGIDARVITDDQCYELTRLRHYKRIKFAWDNAAECGHEVSTEPLTDERRILDGIKILTKYIKPWQLMCYVLIGFNSTEEQDLHRIEMLRGLKIDPFVMPFDKSDQYQRTLARWVNRKAIFKKVEWAEYKRRVEEQEAAGTGWVQK